MCLLFMLLMVMLGAIVGDIVGSTREIQNVKSYDFELLPKGSHFTDDTVMTLAVAKWLLVDSAHEATSLVRIMQHMGQRYPNAGYGERFGKWIYSDNPLPYNSYGNGSAMRVSPVGLYSKSFDETLKLARITATVTHNHPEGVKGAQAIAASIFLCKHGSTKQEIKEYVEKKFGYNLNRAIGEIRKNYGFDVSCQGSVPEAITAFLEGNSFEEVIRLAISLGGDSDTIGAMAGSIASSCYTISSALASQCYDYLTDDLKEILTRFTEKVLTKKKYHFRYYYKRYRVCKYCGEYVSMASVCPACGRREMKTIIADKYRFSNLMVCNKCSYESYSFYNCPKCGSSMNYKENYIIGDFASASDFYPDISECSEEKEILEVSETYLCFKASFHTTHTINVVCNYCDWHIQNCPQWIDISQDNSQYNYFKMTVLPNLDKRDRTGIIKISCGGLDRNIFVCQYGQSLLHTRSLKDLWIYLKCSVKPKENKHV